VPLIGDLIVEFDQPLVAGPLAPDNWRLYYALSWYSFNAALAVASTVRLSSPNYNDPWEPPDAITYTALIPDVIGLASLLPAAPFDSLPIS
jgi:hypothetical protein